MDDIDWILISELYKNRNVTKTAEQLYVTQPTVSKKIKKIEKKFNIIIYHRTSRGITFTEQGEYLAKQAMEITKNLNRVKANVMNISEEMIGNLNIGASNHFAKYELPTILSEFQSKHPLVEFNIQSGYGREIYNLMNSHNIHVGLIRAEYEWNGHKDLLGHDPMCLVSREPIDFKDLPHVPRIEYKKGTATLSMIENWWRNNYGMPPKIGMTVDDVEGCKEMVSNGFGYGILPESIVNSKDPLYKKYLENKDGTPLVINTWMYYTESLLKNKVISEFISFIKNKYEGVSL